eukprot:TRINITY_DN6003_c0_g1_i1.p1 TRINITY_DN6003_c0_g1~~TRINITY_DN6003_c0_g1_i1.p1  ORF type:complete len:642 (-),score=45.29 TRINITY_DN6003_c0_g1_i1:136-2061(-)
MITCCLDQIIERVQYTLTLCFDESSICNLGCCCSLFGKVANDKSLWYRLAVSKDPHVVTRFLGTCMAPVTSRAAFLSANAVAYADLPTHLSGLNWRDVCYQLSVRMAEMPWNVQSSQTVDGSAALWSELTEGWSHASNTERRHIDLPNGGIYGSQAPKMFWLGQNRLLALAGGYSPDMLGGANMVSLNEVYLVDVLRDVLEHSVRNASAHETDASQQIGSVVRAMRLNCGTADGRLPNGHPSMNGCASDFDPIQKAIYFFGGGSPHSEICNQTCMLQLHGDMNGSFDSFTERESFAKWSVVDTYGSADHDSAPSGRQGLQGVVFHREFVIFGGRSLGGTCHNDVWSLDLEPLQQNGVQTHMWRQLECDGTAPSPRVWYGACHAVHGRWFIYGGSTWQFEESDEPHDSRTLFILDLAERRWSSVNQNLGPETPPWVVAPTLLPLGCCQLLLLGGTLPQKVGAQGLNSVSLQRWRSWYSRLDTPHVFDMRSGEWKALRAAVSKTTDRSPSAAEEHITDVYLRSHFAAAFIPPRRSVVIFGGSRYFTGEYFHDLIELQLPGRARTSSSESCSSVHVLGEGRNPETKLATHGDLQAADDLPKHLRRTRGRITLTRGLIGRLRAMARDGWIDPEEFAELLESIREG